MTGSTRPERLGDILPRVLKEVGFGRRNANEDLARAWADVAGPEVSKYTSVEGFKAGRLTVAVKAAPLFQELETFRKEELLKGLRERLAGTNVEELRFRLV